MNYSRKDYDSMAGQRKVAFGRIAEDLGPQHEITKMMGALSYGRHKFEQGPCGNLRTAIAEYGFLEGVFDILNLWARDHDREAQRKMLARWPNGMGKSA